jgi:CrcB protein
MPLPRRRVLRAVLLVAAGGFAGATLRYLVSLFAAGPAGTLAVNAAGSFALGALVYEAVGTSALADEARTLLGTGFLSSLTTYSTFAVETAGLAPLWLVGNVAANYALGFTGVLVGRALALRYGGEAA